jgi:TonB family protein
MLDTLLESKSARVRNRRGAIASVAFHASVILVAVYATASGRQPEIQKDPPTIIHWIPTPVAKPATPAHSAPRNKPSPAAPRSIVVPVEVPTAIPAINLSAAPVTATDFGPGSHSTDTASTATPAPGNNSGRAYDISEVEVPVTSLGGASPEYPSALRSSGVEGRVSAEFVVNEKGRAETSSLHILSTSNDLFADAVRRALPRMRFKPARIGDQSVPQLVRQEFSFVLDR